MKTSRFILSVCLSILLTSCKKDDVDVLDAGYDYFPIESGYYINYEVTEIRFDDFNGTIDTIIYLLKERLDSSFLDVEGRLIYQLERFKSDIDDSLSEWHQSDVWTVYKGKDRVERNEENVTYVRLTFPLSRDKNWNGNARNDSAPQTYRVLDYDLKSTINGTSFSRTCRINHVNEQNLLKDIFSEEVYARGTGLVYREDRKIFYNPTDSSMTSGYRHIWKFVEAGLE